MSSSGRRHVVWSFAVSGGLLVGLFLLVNIGAQIAHAASSDLFVSPTGSGTACYQAQPCALQTALTQATDGDTVYLAGGTYTGVGPAVITLTQSITLYGGWNGASSGPVTRNPDVEPSILDGEGTRRVVYVTGPATVTLDGLTIANGKILSTTTTEWGGAGLYARNAALTVQNTGFYRNVVDVYDVNDSYTYGGGMMAEGGSLLVQASTFRWNSAWAKVSANGGGLAISGTLTATVSDTLFQDNDAWIGSGLYFLGDADMDSPLLLLNDTFINNGWGTGAGDGFGGYAGAIEVIRARAHIEGNVFRNNRASNDRGAVSVSDSELTLARNVMVGNRNARTSALHLSQVSPFTATNNIIAGNQSTYYSSGLPGVYIGNSSSGQLLHNTIARNRNFSGSNVGVAYGVLVEGNSTASLTNTILLSHTVGISVTTGSTASLEGTLWGSGAWANGIDWNGAGTIVTGTVNIGGNPDFVNPDNGDYLIGVDSAARDAGIDAGVTTDIDGDPRPVGTGYDIGADEFAHRIYLPLVTESSS